MVDLDKTSFTLLKLPAAGPPVLACGAWLKNTLCLTQGDQAYLSPVNGNLDTAEARQRLEDMAESMCNMLDIEFQIVAHDLHPDFYSTEFAFDFAARKQIPTLAVQHHHAHIAAICAEHQLTEPVLGLALDGVGLGTDYQPWGGELLLVDGAQFQRIGCLSPFALPGGDRAALEPWRMAAAMLAKQNRGHEIAGRFSEQPAAQTVAVMLQKSINCPQTSSMGRLFDAAAGLLGICQIQSHEAQAAINLQQLAEKNGPVVALNEGYRITKNYELDFSPLMSVLMDRTELTGNTGQSAALFHATLSAGLADWVKAAAKRHNINQLALGGGCFHNKVLLQGLVDRLDRNRINILTAQKIPPDDSAIALGQAWVAIQAKNGWK